MANAFKTWLTDMANSIRNKTGKTEKLSPINYPMLIDSIGGGGGSAEGCFTVTFMNGDEVLLERPVYSGDNCPDPVTQGRFETPTKASTVDKVFTHSGWTSTNGGTADNSILNNITEDKVLYAAYTESIRYYTVSFYDGETLLKTEQVAYGGSSSYEYNKENYIFGGWTPEPTNVTTDMSCYGSWEESYSFADASWEYIARMSESGKATEVFALGDTRTETLTYSDGTSEDVELMIAAFDLYPDTNGNPTITIINKNLLSKTCTYCSEYYSGAYWFTYNDTSISAIKPFLENTVITAFPSSLQGVLRTVTTDYSLGKYYDNKIAPLTVEEVGLLGNAPLYSFSTTDSSRKRVIPDNIDSSIRTYWLYDYDSSKKIYSASAGCVDALVGGFGNNNIQAYGLIMFKIFV